MLIQMLAAFAAVAVLGLILKFFFGRGRDSVTVAWSSTDPADFGLLAPAAVVDDAEDADALRELLADAGIKATKARARDGRYLVLVFRSELNRARQVAGTA